MKFVLEIELGNDAMQTISDVQAALRGVANSLPHDAGTSRGTPVRHAERNIKDDNGNSVGFWAFAEGWGVHKDPEKK